MKIIFFTITLTLTISLVSPSTAKAAKSSPEYLDCVAKYIVQNCPSTILKSNCHIVNKETKESLCDQNLEKNSRNILEYLKQFEINMPFSSVSILMIDQPIIACSETTFLNHPASQYSWNDKKSEQIETTAIECPKEEINHYNVANANGKNSTAIAGDNNRIETSGEGWLKPIIIGLIVSLATWWIIYIIKKRIKQHSPYEKNN